MERVYTGLKKTGELWKWLLYLTAGTIFLVWIIFTPPGILGKADAVGYAFCHRIDLRSFHIGIRQLPLCARCTGQYLGAMIGFCFLGLFRRRQTGAPPRKVVLALILLGLVFVIDGLNSYLYLPPFLKLFPNMPHLYEPTNALRLITGTGMGLVIAVMLYPAFVGSLVREPDTRPVVENLSTILILMIAGGLANLLILNGSQYVLVPAALISTGGLVIILVLVNTVLWMHLLHLENHYMRISQAIFPITLGFIMAIIQIAGIDLFRYMVTGTWSGLNF